MEQTAMCSSVSKTKPIWLVPSPSIVPFLFHKIAKFNTTRSISYNMEQKFLE